MTMRSACGSRRARPDICSPTAKGPAGSFESAGQLWPALDALTPQRPDPLDPTCLDQIESRTAVAELASEDLPLSSLGNRFTIALDGRLDEVVFALWLDLLLYRHGSEAVSVQESLQCFNADPISLHGSDHLNPTLVRRSLRTFQRMGKLEGTRTT